MITHIISLVFGEIIFSIIIGKNMKMVKIFSLKIKIMYSQFLNLFKIVV